MKQFLVGSLLFSLLVYVNVFAVLVVVGFPLLLVLIVAPQRWYVRHSFVFWLLDVFYKSVLVAFLIPVRISGAKNKVKDERVVLIANHESLLDIFFVGALFNGEPHVWYALSYYANMPGFGFLVRHIVFAVNPGKPAEAARGFMRGIRYAGRYGLHIAIFPEGGRFNDGKIHPFMRGFAVAARSLKRPVFPVYMVGNGLVYSPDSWRVSYHPLHGIIGPLFAFQDDEEDGEFVARLEAWFVAESSRAGAL